MWILIVVVLSISPTSPSSITSVEFSSKLNCVLAGGSIQNEILDKSKYSNYIVAYTCSPK